MAKQRIKKRFSEGIVTIKATFNNTLITISDPKGNVLCRASAGSVGYKNAKKGTPHAGKLAADKAANDAIEKYEMKRVAIRVQGPGAGRDSAIRAINEAGMTVIRLEDVTPLPHNGCRPRKKRRV